MIAREPHCEGESAASGKLSYRAVGAWTLVRCRACGAVARATSADESQELLLDGFAAVHDLCAEGVLSRVPESAATPGSAAQEHGHVAVTDEALLAVVRERRRSGG